MLEVRTKDGSPGACTSGVEYELQLAASPWYRFRERAFPLTSTEGRCQMVFQPIGAATEWEWKLTSSTRKQQEYIACMQQKHHAPNFPFTPYTSFNILCGGTWHPPMLSPEHQLVRRFLAFRNHNSKAEHQRWK